MSKENSAQSKPVPLDCALGVQEKKLVTPIVCQLCDMDWQHGGCGECTLTRKQLDGCAEQQRQLDSLVDLNNALQQRLDLALDDHCDSH